MNLDNLTFGEIKQLVAMFGAGAPAKPQGIADQFIGKFCIVRAYAAGVHAGTVVQVDGENCVLRDSVRLWSWEASDGVALSGVAQNGLKDGKIDTVNPLIYIAGFCELIPVSEKSYKTFEEYFDK